MSATKILALLLISACGPTTAQPQQPAGDPPTEGMSTEGQPAMEGQPSTEGQPTTADPPTAPSRPAAGAANPWVAAHNALRAKHCAPPLAWSDKAAAAAQAWAASLRDRGCKFEHSQNNSFGENLAAGTIGTLDPASTVKYWYDEIAQYQFGGGGFSMDTGHFTQVVWKGTTGVGCATVQCNGNDLFVCEYDPPGNWEGQYATNVLPVGCK